MMGISRFPNVYTFIRRCLTGLVFTCSLFVPITSFSLSLDQLEVPGSVTLNWVGAEIEHNGQRMQIQSLRSHQNVETVLDQFRTMWAGKGTSLVPGTMQRTLGEWRILSSIIESSNVVVQLKSDRRHGSVGYLSAMELDDAGSGIEPDGSRFELDQSSALHLPTPRNTQLLSQTRSLDAMGRRTRSMETRTFLMKSSDSLHQLKRFYLDNMSAKNWTLAHQNHESDSIVLMFSRDGFGCEISITQSGAGENLIVLNCRE